MFFKDDPKYWMRVAKRKLIFFVQERKRKKLDQSKKELDKPNTIQLPITFLCNFNCVMCGMRNLINNKDFSAEELGKILEDPLFSEVKTVGLNGGEPYLKEDLVDCVKEIINHLPKLKSFYIISNGYFTDMIINKTKEIHRLCEEKGIKVTLSLSVDGINDMQDFHRGHKDAFVNLEKTIEKLNEEKCVDHLRFICTITRYNIYRINEVEVWADKNGYDISYNVATENIRIDNQERLADFSLFSDEEARMLAQEFFYHLYKKTKNEVYYGLFLYLNEHHRYSSCPCQIKDWITLTPDAQIGYCATYSKNLGSALEESAYEIVHQNTDYLHELCSQKCDTCSHYMQKLNAQGLHKLHQDILKNRFMRGGSSW